MSSFATALKDIADSISRKNANFAIVREPSTGAFVLVAGSCKALRSDEGIVISMGISRERLIALRDLCNQLLGD